ncbi:MAG: hypothetical protein R6X13_04210 [bacterium]
MEFVSRYYIPDSVSARARDLVTGAEGDCYLAVKGSGYGNQDDFMVVGLGPTGSHKWEYWYDGTLNAVDECVAITRLGSRLCAAGTVNSSGTARDVVAVALDTNGAFGWLHRFNGRLNSHDYAADVCLDSSGNAYVTGQCDSNSVLFVLSVNSAGTRRWVYRYDEPGDYGAFGRTIGCGPDGNVYVAGYAASVVAARDFLVVSLTPAGGFRWAYRRSGVGRYSSDDAVALTFDAAGNVCVSGWLNDSLTGDDAFVVSLTSSGSELWTVCWDGPPSDDDRAVALAAPPGGGVCAAITSVAADRYRDAYVFAFDDTGGTRWQYHHPSAQYVNEKLAAICIDGQSDVFAVGSVADAIARPSDVLAQSLSSGGVPRWTWRYDGPDQRIDAAMACAATPNGRIYLCGHSLVTDLEAAALTVCPRDAVAITGAAIEVPGAEQGRARFVRSSFVLGRDLGEVPLVDAAGSVVAILHPGENRLGRLPAGVYFAVRPVGGGFRVVKLD